MAKKKEIITKLEPAEEYFRQLTVTFNSYVGIKQPNLSDSDHFCKVYSPKKFKLKPRGDITIDLKFNVTASKELDPWISLLPTLKVHGLAIVEKYDVQGKTIQLHLQNQNYRFTIEIKKGQYITFIFLLGEYNTDIIKTEYNLLKYILVFLLPLTVRAATIFMFFIGQKINQFTTTYCFSFLAIARKFHLQARKSLLQLLYCRS